MHTISVRYPPMTIPTKGERDAMLAQAIRVLVAMFQERGALPSPRRMGDAVTTSILISALQHRGSVRRAAELVGVPASTFNDQLRRGLPDACHYLPMHGPLDADLFPFVRTRWDNSDLGFVASYFAWLRDEIQPRAHAESTKLILFQNYAPFQGPPTPEFVEAMTSEVASAPDFGVVKGVVIYAPTMPELAQYIVPVNDGTPLLTDQTVRFATQPQVALDHAAQLFSTAGINPPPLHLD